MILFFQVNYIHICVGLHIQCTALQVTCVWSSEDCAPESILAFTAATVNLRDPFCRLADAAAAPIKGGNAEVAGLRFPFTICRNNHSVKFFEVHGKVILVRTKTSPGGVPQHNLRSSICSTSNPMNQAPKETSSFAYLCSTCLNSKKFHSKLDPK